MIDRFQKKVATNDQRIVIAGPGTGKTTTICEKVRFLVKERGIQPGDIAVLSFTKEAAENIRSRAGFPVHASTIHSLAYGTARSLGITSNIIEQEQASLLVEQFGEPVQILNLIDLFRLGKVEDREIAGTMLSDIVEQYEGFLGASGAMDFFQMVQGAKEILRYKPTRRHVKTFEYVIVDEAQDITVSEYEFVKEIVDWPDNLVLVGDPYQSIYSFRGASSIMSELIKAGAKTDILRQTYRYGKRILDYSRCLVERIDIGVDYEMIPNDIEDEVLTLTRENAKVAAKRLSGESCAFLARANYQADELAGTKCYTGTIHSAKGLEWNNVFLLLKYSHSPEETFVNYVAATRAKRRLIIIY
ncbi:MAG TPA: AAA family ATPase [Mesotoga sp.]|nr:AAA family ATPase [Mesotoga sp.]